MLRSGSLEQSEAQLIPVAYASAGCEQQQLITPTRLIRPYTSHHYDMNDPPFYA